MEAYQHCLTIPFDAIFEWEFKDDEVVIAHTSEEITTEKLHRVDEDPSPRWEALNDVPRNLRQVTSHDTISRVGLVGPVHRSGGGKYIRIISTFVLDRMEFYRGLFIDSTSPSSAGGNSSAQEGEVTPASAPATAPAPESQHQQHQKY